MKAWVMLALLAPAAALTAAGAPSPATPTAVTPAASTAASAGAAKGFSWISVDFGPADECGNRGLILQYKAPRQGWQKLLLEPRCSLQWRLQADGRLRRDDASVDATRYEAYWLLDGAALLVLQTAIGPDDSWLLDAYIYRANGREKRVKPAVGNGSFRLAPDGKELWYLSGGDGADGTDNYSLHKLGLADGAETYAEPETLTPDAYLELKTQPLNAITPN